GPMINSLPLIVITDWPLRREYRPRPAWPSFMVKSQDARKGKAAACISFRVNIIFLADMALWVDRLVWAPDWPLQKNTKAPIMWCFAFLVMEPRVRVFCMKP